MGADDLRYYETFYAIHRNYGGITFGTFADHPKVLVKEYINTGCVTTDYSAASSPTNIHEFIYPHHIKKTYFIEGVIFGQITFAAQSDDSTITNYRVTVCKIHENNQKNELFSTGWRTASIGLTWDVTYDIGEDIVLSFEIDAWEKAKLDEKERIYLKVETHCNEYTVLWHSNDAKWEDIRIDIPFKL